MSMWQSHYLSFEIWDKWDQNNTILFCEWTTDIFSLEKLNFFKRKHLSWVYQEGRPEKVAWSKIVSLLVFPSSCATAFYRRPNLFGHHDALIYFLEIISLILFEDYSNMGLKWYNNFFLSFLMVNLEALSSTTIRSRVKKQTSMLVIWIWFSPCYSYLLQLSISRCSKFRLRGLIIKENFEKETKVLFGQLLWEGSNKRQQWRVCLRCFSLHSLCWSKFIRRVYSRWRWIHPTVA